MNETEKSIVAGAKMRKPETDTEMEMIMGNSKQFPEVRCPTCRKKGPWFEAEWGPFCSQRCRLVDLGQWFEEEHRIESPLRPEHFEGYENLPPGKHLDDPDADL